MSCFIFVFLALNVVLLGIHVDAYQYKRWRGGWQAALNKKYSGWGGWGAWGGGTWTPPDTHKSCYCKDATKEPVTLFTSTTGGGRVFTACVTKQTCYKVCDSSTCATYTVKCIDRATITSKPGLCPKNSFPSITDIKINACTKDSDCSERKKCCLLSSKEDKQCVEPVGSNTKCGLCGGMSGCFINSRYKEKSCTKDVECRDSWKCCPCGSTKKCHPPQPHFNAPVPS